MPLREPPSMWGQTEEVTLARSLTDRTLTSTRPESRARRPGGGKAAPHVRATSGPCPLPASPHTTTPTQHGARAAPGGSAAGDLAGALLAQRTQVDGGPGAVGPPRLRDIGEGAAGAVPLGDLGVQSTFVVGQRVGGVRAADHDQLGSERAEPF